LEPEFLKDIILRLERSGVLYALTGSIASSFWGTPRTTHDVDVVVLLSAGDEARVLTTFADSYYVSDAAVRDAVQRQSMFNVIGLSTSLKADIWVSRDDPFNREMLARRRREEILPGLAAYLGTAEDILLHKLVWHTITPSERQLNDAAGIAAIQAGKLDTAYMRQWAAKQSTSALLEDVLAGKYLKQT
jgi:hypothetical protein